MSDTMGRQALDAGVSLYNGLDGIPFRTRNGPPPAYKHDDPPHAQPLMVVDMHVDRFDLSDDAQVARFQEILGHCARGRGYVSSQHTEYDKDIKAWRVLLVWGEYFFEDPKEAHDAVRKTW